MKEFNWIKDLKVGDEVIVVSGGWSIHEHVEVVEKVNKTTVRVCGSLFTFDGYERTSGWHHARIEQCTEEAKARIKMEAERKKLAKSIEATTWANLPIDKLRRINAIIKEP